MKSEILIFVLISINSILIISSSPVPQADVSSGGPVNPECKALDDDAATFHNTTDFCMKKLKLSEGDLPMMDDTFEKNGYDDKCMFNCIFNQVGFLTADGDVKDEAIQNFNRNLKVSDTLKKNLETMITECVASSRKMVEADGGPKGAVCKFSSVLAVCLGKGEDKVCQSTKA